MNFRGTLILTKRVFRLPQCQTIFNKCLATECPGLAKIPQSNFSSLVCRTNGPLSAHFMLMSQRNYASKKGVKKKGNVQVNMTGLGELIEVDDMVNKMEAALESMKTDYIKSLSLRSSGSLESIKVKFEGKEYELQQIAKMTRKGQQTVVVDMLSFPQMTKAVVDSLKSSALNLNPQQEGTTIFVPIPKVTKEHREILAKKAKAIFITCRDILKKVQEENIKELRVSNIPETEKDSAYKQVRAVADKYVTQAESIMKTKQDELLGK